MIKQKTELRNYPRVKEARQEYLKRSVQSAIIEEQIYQLIEEKQILLTPVVRMKMIVMDKVEQCNQRLAVLIEQHKIAIDRCLEYRHLYIDIQNEMMLRREKYPEMYGKKTPKQRRDEKRKRLKKQNLQT